VLDNLVSYRVAELVSDDYIRGKVEKDPFWVELLSFWRSLDDLRQRKKRPILCEEHPAPTEEPRAPSGQ
jgi:hypothetical protein